MDQVYLNISVQKGQGRLGKNSNYGFSLAFILPLFTNAENTADHPYFSMSLNVIQTDLYFRLFRRNNSFLGNTASQHCQGCFMLFDP